MKTLIATVAFAMLAAHPAKAALYDGTNNPNSSSDTSQDATTQNLQNSSSQEMDTTLTDQPGVLEEQNKHSTLDRTLDQPASNTTINNHSENYYFPPADNTVQSGTTAAATDSPMSNQSTAVAPRGIDGRGAWNINAGPALSLGLNSDAVLYGIGAGYTFNLTPALGARIFGDANFGSGTDSAQYLDVGAAAKLGMGDIIGQQTSRAYFLGDVALANARNANTNDAKSGVALGAGIGYNILRTQRTDVDLLLHYALMMSSIDQKTPSLLTARLGVNF